jgi:hypothetical protein
MNLLDENVREDQRSLLRTWGLPIQQIGSDVGRKGMKDEEIIPLLHTLRDVTFFSFCLATKCPDSETCPLVRASHRGLRGRHRVARNAR